MVHQSVSVIKEPEFINLSPNDINALVSNCQIKVLYIGENRNRSYISKEVAEDMAKSLRGTPIVGYYIEDKKDFGDHGEQLIIDGEGFHFNTLTKPYGFVAPDAKVWFQDFEDMDERGVKTTRTYLVTDGYLWTGQFEECRSLLTSTKSQSMELDSETLNGEWSNAVNNNYELFIINDAIFSKLCILGDDVEPCFEGASVAPKTYNLDFQKTLFSMIKDLQEIKSEGRVNSMNTEIIENKENNEIDIAASVAESAAATTFTENNENNEKNQENLGKANQEESSENENTITAEQFSLLSQEYEELKNKNAELVEKYSKLEQDYSELLTFKKNVENEKKDELIKSFYMLSNEDKKDVIENKEKYSLDEIEAKLSVIYFRKKINFASEKEESEGEKGAPVTYSLDDATEDVPAWLNSIRDAHNKNK